VRFDLALDQIDLDRYLGPGEAGKTAAPATPAGPTAAGAKPAPAKPVEIPLSTLRSLDINGKFRVGTLKAFNLRSSDARIQVNARNGLIGLGPNSARLYQGSYRGVTEIDARGKALRVKLDEQLEQVQVGPLLKDMRLFGRYSGTGNIAVKLTGQGLNAEQITRSLNGTARIDFRNGKIEGVDLVRLIEQSRALYDATRGKPVTMKTRQGDETVFRALTANIVVANGIARNDDLVLDGDNLRATGRGSADLTRETLDYRLKVTVAGEATSKGQTVPVLVGGSFSNPTYSVDFGELVKQEAQKQLEKQLQKGLEDFLKKRK
jgi:AsmA protein